MGQKSVEVVVAGARAQLRREPWDCDRLGVETAKVEQVVIKDDGAKGALGIEILRMARAESFVLLASRVDVNDRLAVACLEGAGFRLVDTVVTLETVLTVTPAPPTVPRGYSLRPSTAPDRAILGELAAEAFTNPNDTHNRYLNDTFIPMEAVKDVYRTWVSTSIDGPAADLTLAVEHAGVPIAFITLSLPPEGNAKVGLNAVRPSHRGLGLYRLLVEAAFAEVWRTGIRRVSIVTQLQQLAVQHVWIKLGAFPVAAAHSFHHWLPGGAPVRSLNRGV